MPKTAPNSKALLQPSARSRYNLRFVSKLHKILEQDPESDIQQYLNQYDRKRFLRLKGSSTTTRTTLESKQEGRQTLPLECPIPEPCGHCTILSPFAPQLNTLFGLDPSDTSNSFPNFPSALYRLLKDGEVLHHILSKWVLRISPSIVVKFAPDLDIGEIQTMYHIWPRRQKIPMPEPLGAVSVGSYNYIFMSYVKGDSLADIWSSLSPELKTSVQNQLGQILQCLRNIPLQSKYLGSGNPPFCRDLRRHVRKSSTSISTETEFNSFLVSTKRELNPIFLNLCTAKLTTCHQMVMTHSDIRPENILVSRSGPHIIKISGLVDWELSGAYPDYWEYVKALAGVNCDLSDWYSYLPIDIIGDHSDAWYQDALVSRLVL